MERYFFINVVLERIVTSHTSCFVRQENFEKENVKKKHSSEVAGKV